MGLDEKKKAIIKKWYDNANDNRKRELWDKVVERLASAEAKERETCLIGIILTAIDVIINTQREIEKNQMIDEAIDKAFEAVNSRTNKKGK